jgi:hypothetical protein
MSDTNSAANLPRLADVMVHVDPHGQGGKHHRRVRPHSHDDLLLRSHE